MSEKLELGERNFTLALAASTIVQLGTRHDISDDDMNAAAGRALEIVFAAEAEDPKALAYVLDAMGRLHTVVEVLKADRGEGAPKH